MQKGSTWTAIQNEYHADKVFPVTTISSWQSLFQSSVIAALASWHDTSNFQHWLWRKPQGRCAVPENRYKCGQTCKEALLASKAGGWVLTPMPPDRCYVPWPHSRSATMVADYSPSPLLQYCLRISSPFLHKWQLSEKPPEDTFFFFFLSFFLMWFCQQENYHWRFY